MRLLMAGLVVTLASTPAFAQAPAPAASRTVVPSSEVTALVARAKADRKDEALIGQRLFELAPYNVSLDYRVSVGPAAVHDTEAELFYVIDGAATLVTGGTLANEKRTNAENSTGTGIDGGQSRRIAKGDFIMVPEGVPHWFSAIDGSVVMMSLHLPRKPATPAR